MIQAKNLAQILLRLISAHPDTFVAKIDNAPASWGGGPQRVAALDDLGTINPKIDPMKESGWHAFEGGHELPGPVRSH